MGIVGSSGSHVTRNDVTGTGSHVIWRGKPRNRREKGSRAQGGGKTADPLGKMDRGRRTAEERGLRVQSPIGASGEVLDSKKRRHVGKTIFYWILEQSDKRQAEFLL